MAATKAVKLPTVSAPDLEQRIWKEDPSKRRPLLSTADSLVLIQSLRQSRNAWLLSAFSKFQTNKSQAQHTATMLGTCDFELGPHIFPGTKFYEIVYQYASTITANQQKGFYPSPSYSYSNMASSSTTSPHTQSQSTQYSNNQPPVASSNPGTPTPTARLDSPTPKEPTNGQTPTNPFTPTPSLISSIDAAAARDPELRRLLGVAAEGKATADELADLSQRVKTIQAAMSTNGATASATAESPSTGHAQGTSITPAAVPPTTTWNSPSTFSSSPAYPSYPPSTQRAVPSQPLPTIDIIFEYAENPNDRFILPLNNSIVERVIHSQENLDPSTGRKIRSCDIMISTVMPPGVIESRSLDLWGMQSPTTNQKGRLDCHPTTMKLVDAPSSLWLAVSKRVDYKNEARKEGIARVLKDLLQFVPPRTYLQHRIPENATHNNLKSALGLAVPDSVRRKEPDDMNPDETVAAPSPKKPRVQKPSGLRVEVVIPARRSTSFSMTAAAAQPTIPQRPSGRKVEVVIPARKVAPPPKVPTTPTPSTSAAGPSTSATPIPTPAMPAPPVMGSAPSPHNYWTTSSPYRKSLVSSYGSPTSWNYWPASNSGYYNNMYYNYTQTYGQTAYSNYTAGRSFPYTFSNIPSGSGSVPQQVAAVVKPRVPAAVPAMPTPTAAPGPLEPSPPPPDLPKE